MNTEGIRRFWNKHKTHIIFGATTASVGVACYLLGNRHACLIKLPESYNVHLPTPERCVGDWESFWVNTDNGHPMGMIRDIHVQFMGDLGAEIFDHCEECGLDQVVYDCPVNIMFDIVSDK